MLGEHAGVAAFELFEEVVGVGLAEQGADLAEQAGCAAEGVVEAIDEVAGQLTLGDPLVNLLIAAEELEGVVGRELGQGQVEDGGEVDRRPLGQVAAGDDGSRAPGQVAGEGVEEFGEVGVGDAAGLEVEGVLEVVEGQDEPEVVEAVDGQAEPLAGGEVAVGQDRVDVEPVRLDEGVVEGREQVTGGRSPGVGWWPPVLLAADLDRDQAEADRLEPIHGAGGQRALAGPADPGEHRERRVAMPERRDQSLCLAATADVAGLQPLDPSRQEGVDRPGAVVGFSPRRVDQGRLGADPIKPREGEGCVLEVLASMNVKPRPADRVASVGGGDRGGVVADEATVELGGELGGAVVGHARRPAQRGRHAGGDQTSAKAGDGGLRGLAAVDERQADVPTPERQGDLVDGPEVGVAALVLEAEDAPAVGVDVAVAREVDDVRPALGDQLGQFVEAAGLGEVGDDLPLHVGRGPEHQVLFPLVVELDRPNRRRGEEQDPERTRSRREAIRALRRIERSPVDRPAGVTADRDAGGELDQLPGQVEDVRIVGLYDPGVRAGSLDGRFEGVEGRYQPGFGEGSTVGPERFGAVERPSSVLLEEREESPADLAERGHLVGFDSDRVVDRPAVDGPTGTPGGFDGVDPEGQRGHRVDLLGVKPFPARSAAVLLADWNRSARSWQASLESFETKAARPSSSRAGPGLTGLEPVRVAGTWSPARRSVGGGPCR